jgi:hypothetical protein
MYTHPAFSLRSESASDGSSLVLSKLNGAFISVDLKVIRMLSKIWNTPPSRIKAATGSDAAANKEAASKKPKKSGVAGLHFLSDVSSALCPLILLLLLSFKITMM